MRPSGHRFRAAQRLERDGASFAASAPVALALTGGRDASVAWTGFDGANARVRVASTDPSARFGAPQDVSPAGRDGVVSDLAAAGGTRLVVWDNGSFDANQVFAAVAPAGAAFGAAEAVSAAQEARAGRAVLAADADRRVDQPAGRLAPAGRARRDPDLRPGGDAQRLDRRRIASARVRAMGRHRRADRLRRARGRDRARARGGARARTFRRVSAPRTAATSTCGSAARSAIRRAA